MPIDNRTFLTPWDLVLEAGTGVAEAERSTNNGCEPGLAR
jgi:hypothetical protein